MFLSIAALCQTCVGFYNINDSFDFELIHFVIIVSFIFLFIRFYFGDSNYNEICANSGLNDKHHSSSSILKNKPIIDSGILFVQGLLFIVLAALVYNPTRYFVCYALLILVNIVWLTIQHYCWTRFTRCTISKASRIRNYSKANIISRIDLKLKVDKIILTWLANNIIYLFSAVILFLLAQFISPHYLLCGIGFAIFSSIIDLKTTFKIYSRPHIL